MQVITVASDLTNKGFIEFLKPSCEFYDLNAIVLEYDEPFFSNRLKDALLEHYLNQVSDDEIILFTDATDAAFLCGAEEILTKFYAFDSSLVFSAEINCWPDPELAKGYPSGSFHFKFLNSGAFIGTAGFIKSIYQKYPVFSTATHPHYNWSNQYYWNTVFVEEHRHIKLDHSCELFYNTSIKLDDIGDFKKRLIDPLAVETMLTEESSRLDKEIRFVNRRVKSDITNTTPCHIHFPGPISKKLMESGYFNEIKKW